MSEQPRPLSDDELARTVSRAMQAAGRNNLGPVSALQRHGPRIVPLLAPYVNHDNQAIRREAVMLAAGFAGPAALGLLARAVADPSADVRHRAANALYGKYDRAKLAGCPELGRALVRSAYRDTPAATTVLLLANFPSPETERALCALNDRLPAANVKLNAWAAPVTLSLTVKVAQARLGSGKAQAALVRAAEAATPAEAEFLLAVIGEADGATALRALARFLDDTREAATLAHAAPEMRRRLCDLAVESFVRRLELPIRFKLAPLRRYDDEQIDEVRRLVAEGVTGGPLRP